MALLKEKLIIDLSHRLPGPLAGKLLCDLGAKVIKVEDKKFGDPFNSGLFKQQDNHFVKWYHTLNQDKEVQSLDFNSGEDLKKLHQLLGKADALLLALPEKVCQKLGIAKESIREKFPNLNVICLKATRGRTQNLHDLNAVAMAGLLDMHLFDKQDRVVAPPFLPVAGISFGHWVATKLLALMLSKQNWIEAYLDEATENVLAPFKSCGDKKPQYLHNGKFPCYSLYQLKTGKFLAVACVEEKFWNEFNQLFNLNLEQEDRFNTDNKVFKHISDKIYNMSGDEVATLIEGKDICLTLI